MSLDSCARERRPFDARADLRERGLPSRGRVVTEGSEPAIVAGAQLCQRNVLRGLQHSVADFLRCLDPRIDGIDHPDEYHLLRLEMVADDSEDPDGILLPGQGNEEASGHELEQARKQRGIVNVGAVRGVEVTAWTRVHADARAVLSGKS